ncbi:hypothetical protein BC833DRAFT_166848 [Globomyces pollinis-pini]|nr:hypothetical protein BC833DRAFT_166848 [Globomyces pollinis-pini]
MSVATDGVGYSPVSADPRHSASLDLNYPTQEDIPTQHQYSPNTVADLNNARYPPPAQYDNSLASQEPTHNQQPVVNKYDVFYTTPGGLTPSSSQPSPYTVRPSFDPLMNSKEDYDDYKAPRARICCCFKSICSCCCCFLFIILLLAILLYLAFPGLPTATVSDLYIPTNSAGLQTSQSEDGTIKISMDYATDVSLYSPSFFSITMEKFTVQVDLKSQTGSIIPGFGGKGVVNNINFKSKTNTTFTIPLTVTYSTSKDEFANNNPVQILLTDSCLATPQKGLETRITMTAVLSLISWIGYNPSFGFTKSVPCPDKDRLESILKNIS